MVSATRWPTCQTAAPKWGAVISLIGNQTGKLRDLQLVFESPARSFTLVGKVQTQAPSLWLNDTGDAEGVPVPLVDLHWRLIMPDGFSVSHGDGKFQSDQLVARPSPIQQLGNWVYRLGGGIGNSYYRRARTRSMILPTDDSITWQKALDNAFESKSENGGRGFGSGSRPDDSPLRGHAIGDELEESEPDPFAKKKIPPQEAPATDPPSSKAPGNPSGGQAGERFRDSGPDDDRKKQSLWALSGLRSLNIQLTDTGNAIEFYNLGEQPTLTATVVHQSRLNWIAIAFAFMIAALGLSLIHI